MYIKPIYDDLRSRHASVTSLIDLCDKEIAKYPAGQLRISKTRSRVYYYHVVSRDHPNGTIIDVSDFSLHRSLAQRTYLEALARIARKEEHALRLALDNYPVRGLEKIYESYSPERKKLVSPFCLPDDEFLQSWSSKPYKGKGFKEGQPVYTTMKGERVRSKSEQLIADRLYVNGIPYKYECPLVINGITFHPDFTILRMSDRKELYYEHLGRMDDSGYASDNVAKLNHYARNGIRLGDNLFLTLETRDHPLDINLVEQMIRKDFR